MFRFFFFLMLLAGLTVTAGHSLLSHHSGETLYDLQSADLDGGYTLLCRDDDDLLWQVPLEADALLVVDLRVTEDAVWVCGSFTGTLAAGDITVAGGPDTDAFSDAFSRLTGDLLSLHHLSGQATTLARTLVTDRAGWYLFGHYGGAPFLLPLTRGGSPVVSIDMDGDAHPIWPRTLEHPGKAPGSLYITQTSGSPADTSGNTGGGSGGTGTGSTGTGPSAPPATAENAG